MANRNLKEKVLKDRIENQTSYSELKKKFGVSKSTLSGWLKNYPLSRERINSLRAYSEKRIERFRVTMAQKQKNKLDLAYNKVGKDILRLSDREIFLSGLFLYWAEGGKTSSCAIILTNTNPIMLKFYIKWLSLLGISKSKLRVSLHLYSDMNINSEVEFWSKTLKISANQFRKPYVKKSLFSSITYKNGFGHGTCSVIYENKPMRDYVLMGIKRIQDLFD
jgi:transposase-like protein